ncbi:MAG TPA: CRISPR-associated RAMP protein Csx7 [Blastocatellia bacterium]|nr:CRISPR-associated RAMP protein Csx7 [Blastocatellia bacterium]
MLLLHDKLENRFEIRGAVLMETALHVGTGQTSATTDAGVVRDFQGRPFIPGSSLKGALRSAVERRVEWLRLHSCYLKDRGCLGDVDERWRRSSLEDREADMDVKLCAVCKLFGSTVLAGKLQIDDLLLEKHFQPLAHSLTEVRDGVAIDRDTGTAVDKGKFDYEVVPSLTAFRLYLTAENVGAQDQALLALALIEMMNGAVPIGGKSTRGLGRCRLVVESLYYFDFSKCTPLDSEILLQFLKPPDERREGKVENARGFLEERIRLFLRGGNDA